MNETILNARQEQILKLLKEKGRLSRSDLSEFIPKRKASRITLIRDLNELIKAGFVVIQGRGRATRYGSARINPILEYVNLDRYFSLSPEERGAKSGLNHDLYRNLANLYSKEEISLWEKGADKFKEGRRKLDPSIYKREMERFVIELSWKSSQIEGNTYSLIETETLIKENIRASGHPEEEARMILNHKDAFKTILSQKESFKKLDFTDVIQLHNILTKDLVTAGIRSQKVRITGTVYEPLADRHGLEVALRELIKYVNVTKYPPEKALILAIMIAYLQPFADGNKRMSRMLANAVLMAEDYPPLSYRSVDVNEYRSAMIVFYETNNLFHFKRIFVDQLEFAIENYFKS